MAARTRGKSVKPTIAIDEANPLSWLFLNPMGPSASGIAFGVLRSSYAGRANSAHEFGWRKAHPVTPTRGVEVGDWKPTAERIEVLLPKAADDALADPSVLLQQMDACALPWEKALLIYATLPLPDADRLHSAWEIVRAFVRERIVRDRGLPTMLVLYAPGRSGSPNFPHAHACILPRAVGALGIGHGVYDQGLIHDGGQALIETMWREHKETFR